MKFISAPFCIHSFREQISLFSSPYNTIMSYLTLFYFFFDWFSQQSLFSNWLRVVTPTDRSWGQKYSTENGATMYWYGYQINKIHFSIDPAASPLWRIKFGRIASHHATRLQKWRPPRLREIRQWDPKNWLILTTFRLHLRLYVLTRYFKHYMLLMHMNS